MNGVVPGQFTGLSRGAVMGLLANSARRRIWDVSNGDELWLLSFIGFCE